MKNKDTPILNLKNKLKNLSSYFLAAIISIFVFGFIGTPILYFCEEIRHYVKSILISPTPLWLTIGLCMGICLYFYIQTWGFAKPKDYIFITEMGLLWKVVKATRKLNPIPLCPKHKHEMLEIKDSYICHSCPSASRKTMSKENVNFVRALVTSKIDAAIDGHLKK